MSKLLRPSARQMRSDFEQRAFSGISGSGTLAGLGFGGGRAKLQDERSGSEFKKRVTAQEEAISDLQREILDADLSREALEHEHASVKTFVSEICRDERNQSAMIDYVDAAEAAAASLDVEISHGRDAVANLRKISQREDSDLNFLLSMIAQYRGRVLSSIPSSAGLLFVPERFPDRKSLPDRKSRPPPPMSPHDENPERSLVKSLNRKFDRIANALIPCVWHRQQRRVCLLKDGLARLRAVDSADRTNHAERGATVQAVPTLEMKQQSRPHTSGVMTRPNIETLMSKSHTASFFAKAKLTSSPYLETMTVKTNVRRR